MRCLPMWIAATALGCASGSARSLVDETFQLPALRAPRSTGTAPPADEADLAGPVTRTRIVALAAARDPSLRALVHEARALLHTARAERALPPPEVGAQVWNLPIARPYALGEAAMYMLEVRQMFPAAGARDARARASAEEARERVAALADREADVRSRAGQAWADYVHGALDHHVHGAHLELLGVMLDAARARFAGGGALAEIPRIEAERARTRRSIARVEAELARARATLNALLLRAPDAPLGPPAELGPETVAASVDDLTALALRTRGDVAMSHARMRAAHARSDVARAEARWPAFTAGASYMQDPQQRPGFGATVAATLPWVWGDGPERVEAALERERAEAATAESAAVTVRGEVSVALARLHGLEHELVVLHTEERPAASRAVEAVRAAYVGGHAPLLEWIDAARQVLDVEMEEVEVTSSMAHAAVDLDRAVGMPVPRRAFDADASDAAGGAR